VVGVTHELARGGGDDVDTLLEGVQGGRYGHAAHEQKDLQAGRRQVLLEQVQLLVCLLRQLPRRLDNDRQRAASAIYSA
jgi:hypothetical protein